ncbi:hypothetical protein NADFUDRAFT_40711 [Nadsonia fulvescens var. elongata DSM 6958]|uniref:Uncharacterized protein n=1 Tax=Nadsonia fulvescens var. elongata DSM 6958 TaxID=857566 RepID=A0A1E3PQH9_9ASCO|nr:hypothetical protein NADFUDRAFT_40711 [Nadsonia fulvescens var. elongata DSM 6958]
MVKPFVKRESYSTSTLAVDCREEVIFGDGRSTRPKDYITKPTNGGEGVLEALSTAPVGLLFTPASSVISEYSAISARSSPLSPLYSPISAIPLFNFDSKAIPHSTLQAVVENANFNALEKAVDDWNELKIDFCNGDNEEGTDSLNQSKLKTILKQSIHTIDALKELLDRSKSTSDKYSLQSKLLTIEMHEMIQRHAVELSITKREVDILKNNSISTRSYRNQEFSPNQSHEQIYINRGESIEQTYHRIYDEIRDLSYEMHNKQIMLRDLTRRHTQQTLPSHFSIDQIKTQFCSETMSQKPIYGGGLPCPSYQDGSQALNLLATQALDGSRPQSEMVSQPIISGDFLDQSIQRGTIDHCDTNYPKSTTEYRHILSPFPVKTNKRLMTQEPVMDYNSDTDIETETDIEKL